MSNAISKIEASIAALHGDERDRAAKYDSFIAWQIKQRLAAKGLESSILKINEDDPCDEVTGISTERR